MFSLSTSIAGPLPLANPSLSQSRGWRVWSVLQRAWRRASGQGSTVRRIDPKEPLVLAHDNVRMVVCMAGTVWVTQGGGSDYILNAGENLRLEPADSVVVSAMRGSATVRYGASPESGEAVQAEPAVRRLSARERECVAIGAALGSNCIPCVEFHIPVARKAGITDAEILEAVRIADRVRKVPAAKVMAAATTMLGVAQTAGQAEGVSGGCA